jgi:hypothetical protein
LALAELAGEREDVREILDGPLGHVEAATILSVSGYNTSESSVRRYRAGTGWTPPSEDVELPPDPPSGWEKTYEMGDDGGTVCSGPVEAPITDPQQLLRIWNLDPDHIEIVGNMTVKAWDVAVKEKKPTKWHNGKPVDWVTTIKTKTLYSYKATVRKKQPSTLRATFMQDWHTALLNYHAPKHVRYAPSIDEPITYLAMVADPQLGKEGTEEAVENWLRGVDMHAGNVEALMDAGYDLEVAVAFMGDETEGYANNYGNQPHTIELNQSEQLELDYDMRIHTLKTLWPMGTRRRGISVRSNHGEWTRNGGKDVLTTRADNSSTFIAKMVQKTFAQAGIFQDAIWDIGDSGPDVVVDLSGVGCYFSHFYEAKGKGGSTEIKTRSGIERQIIGRTEEVGALQLFFTAHFHHYYFQEFGNRTQFGCPALEAERSSGWFLNQYGVWSPPGLLGMTVGASLGPRGYASPNVY